MTKILDDIAAYYGETFEKFGDTPQGVDWRDRDGQSVRFERLIREFDFNDSFSILDVGCGTGALAEYLTRNVQYPFTYCGIDLVPSMISCATSKFSTPNITFANTNLNLITDTFDFVVASGIFNVKQKVEETEWEHYVDVTIAKMFQLSKKAVAFNLLTSLVDYRDPSLFYADSGELFTRNQRKLSRFAILDHSYPLYEFTATFFKNRGIYSRSTR